MDVRAIVEGLKSLSDEELFLLLDGTSEEVKRRNGMLGPSISQVRSNSVGENVKLVVDAIASVRKMQDPTE
jgi:hypothetical protein